MDIQERLKKIAPYAITFHCDVGVEENNTAFLIVSLPEGWAIQEKTINTQFGVVLYQQNGFYYFVLSNANDDYENLFDAVEFTITLNKTLEEKKAIFKAKANELKQLFATSSLEELKSLSFTTVAGKQKGKKGKVNDPFNIDLDNDVLVPENEVEKKETTTTTKKGKGKTTPKNNKIDESDAESLINSLPD